MTGSNDALPVTGSCHCGAIRFSATVMPSRVMVCHCSDCQRLTGSPYRVVVPATRASLVMAGEPRIYERVGDSGGRRLQAFCPTCASPIYAAAVGDSTTVSLRVGTLDQRAELTPMLQIWKRSAQAWAMDALSDVPGSDRQEAIEPR